MTEQKQAASGLEIRDLHAYFGDSHVLHGVNLKVPAGQLVTLLGRNGVGKSTTLRSITGVVTRRTGSVRLDGNELLEVPRHRISRLGIGYVPEERGIFSSLDVDENLTLPPVVSAGGMTLERIYALFPNLQGRSGTPGTRLSGGEQQMLAIARVLRTGARMLLLDEPTEGLAPVIVQQIGDAIQALKQEGFTILLVEQNFRFAQSISDRFYVMEDGLIVDEIECSAFGRSAARIKAHLGV